MVRSENDIWRIIIELVRAGMAENYPGVEVRRVYQGSTQAAGDKAQVTLFRVGGRRVGSLGKSEKWNTEESCMYQIERWRRELTVQAGAIVPFTTNPEAFTATDVLELLSVHLHGDAALKRLHQEGVGILHITELREYPLKDDDERFTIAANFDFTLTWTQSRQRKIPVLEGAEFITHRV